MIIRVNWGDIRRCPDCGGEGIAVTLGGRLIPVDATSVVIVCQSCGLPWIRHDAPANPAWTALTALEVSTRGLG